MSRPAVALVSLFLVGMPVAGQVVPARMTPWLDPFVIEAKDPGGRRVGIASPTSEPERIEGGYRLSVLPGPGVLTRLRIAGSWHLRIRDAGAAGPPFETALDALRSGSVPGFPAPLCDEDGTLVPIPLRGETTIEVFGKDPDPPDFEIVARLGADLPPVEADGITRAAALFSISGRPPYAGRRTDRLLRHKAKLDPHGSAEVFSVPGAGRLLSLRVYPLVGNEAAVRALVLEVHYDGAEKPSISAPIGDLFGASFGAERAAGLLHGWDAGGGYLHWPMPFREGLKIRVRNRIPEPIEALVSVVLREATAEEPIGNDRLQLRHGVLTKLTAGREPILEVEGQGRVVGVTMALQGNTEGALDAVTAGLDVFEEGAARSGVPESPWLGIFGVNRRKEVVIGRTLLVSRIDRDDPWRATAARSFFGDLLPFGNRVTLWAEGREAAVGAELRATVLWYGPRLDVVPASSAESLFTRRLVRRDPAMVVASSLPWSGTVDVRRVRWEEVAEEWRSPDLPADPTAADSRLLLFPGGAETRRFSTTLRVPSAGRYTLAVVLTAAKDGPELALRLGGIEVGRVKTRGGLCRPRPAEILGPIELPAGEVALEVEVPPIGPEIPVGIDALRLAPVR